MMILSIKRLIGALGVICLLAFLGYNSCYAKPLQGLNVPDVTSTLTQDGTKVIDTSSITGNPITEGTNATVGKTTIKGKIEGLIDTSTTNYNTVLNTTIQKIQNIINRSLGFLAFICVIYLVYHGIMMLVKFDDDKAQTDALGSIKTVAWVLGGIGLTWFIVSTAFYVVSLIGGGQTALGNSQGYNNGLGGGGYSLEDDLNNNSNNLNDVILN